MHERVCGPAADDGMLRCMISDDIDFGPTVISRRSTEKFEAPRSFVNRKRIEQQVLCVASVAQAAAAAPVRRVFCPKLAFRVNGPGCGDLIRLLKISRRTSQLPGLTGADRSPVQGPTH